MSAHNSVQNGTASSQANEDNTCPYELWNEEVLHKGRWLLTKQIHFRKRGTTGDGVWQSAHRATRPANAPADGIDIIAILRKQGKKYLILVKQYRIPLRGWSIEFPAGLIDGTDQSSADAGIREFKEETGYTISKVVSCSKGRQMLDPGITDDSLQFLTVEVDGDAPENQNPKQSLEDDEHIEVITVEFDRLLEYLDELTKQSPNTHIEAMVYSFAVGCSLKKMIPDF
ncbi:ADP-sugar pyrophosphatase [Aphelenchoides avenae]|nr:ADP-sugar pyrophosphatase [Aphelenchus avenae]